MTDDLHLIGDPAEARRQAALAQGAASARRARKTSTAPSPHLGDDTPAGRVALFLDGHVNRGSVDPEVIMSIATPVTGGRMADLIVSDLRAVLAERNAPAARIATLAAEAVLPLLAEPDNDQPFVPDFAPADAEAAKLSAEELERLAIVFSTAKDLMWQAYAEARRRGAQQS